MGLKLASESAFRRIVETALAASTGDDTVIRLNDSETTTLRLANNQVVQHVSERTPALSIQVAFGKRSGRASTNRLDERSVADTVREAEKIAKVTPEDPEYLPPLQPQRYPKIPTYRAATAATTPTDLAQYARPVVEACEKRALSGAGIFTSSVSARGVAASTGLFAYEQATEAEFSLTATAPDSSGWTYNAHRDIQALDVDSRAGIAIDKAIRSREPRELEPGHYPVILEPAAVAGILGPVFWGAGAKNYYKGNSPFVDKLGSLVLDPRLTLQTKPTHSDLLGTRFDFNGLAARPVEWINKGVLKQLYYDRFTAKEHDVEPTPWPRTPVLTFSGPTADSIDDLVTQTDRAVLITNFWYIRSVDPADITITGMTRDGTFLVEDGRIVCGVKNFRFHDSPLRCMRDVEAATHPMEAITLERGKMLLPALKLPDFHLSSITKF